MSKYIKFACECCGPKTPLAHFAGFAELNEYRRKLLQLRLIGEDTNGIGFGNVSIRDGTTDNFYITGSATAGIAKLKSGDCAKVVSYDFNRNWIRFEGSAFPSSESLTHAAVYESDKNAGAVIHCHDLKLWRALLHQIPASSARIEYGTPEMAREVMRLFKKTDVKTRKVFVMTGHEGGLIVFGKDLPEAVAVLMHERKAAEAGRFPKNYFFSNCGRYAS